MKKIIILLCCLWSVAQAQVSGYTTVNTRMNYPNGIAAGDLIAPAGGTATIPTGAWGRAGHLYVDTTGGNKGLFYYRDGVWIRVSDTSDIKTNITCPSYLYTMGADTILLNGDIDGRDNSFPSVVLTNSLKRLIMSYRDGTTHTTGGKLLYKISDNFGQTWGTAVEMESDTSLDWRSLIISKMQGDTLLAVYWDRNGVLYKRISIDNGTTFGSRVQIGGSLGIPLYSEGKSFVYNGYNCIPVYAQVPEQCGILYNVTVNGSSTWSVAWMTDGNTYDLSESGPVVYEDSVIFFSRSDLNQTTCYRTVLKPDMTFTSSFAISVENFYASKPDAFLMPDKRILLTYRSEDGVSPQHGIVAISSNKGLTFDSVFSQIQEYWYYSGTEFLGDDLYINIHSGLTNVPASSIYQDYYKIPQCAVGLGSLATSLEKKGAPFNVMDNYFNGKISGVGSTNFVHLTDVDETALGKKTWGDTALFSSRVTVSGQTNINGEFLNQGSGLFRIENSGNNVPVGSTGVGHELFVSGGTAYINPYNRSSPGNAPLALVASTIAGTGTTTWNSPFTMNNSVFNLGGTTSPLQVNGSAGTAGQILKTNGSGLTPSWIDQSSIIGATPTWQQVLTAGSTLTTTNTIIGTRLLQITIDTLVMGQNGHDITINQDDGTMLLESVNDLHLTFGGDLDIDGLVSSIDTTTYKPFAISTGGITRRMNSWAQVSGGGGGGWLTSGSQATFVGASSVAMGGNTFNFSNGKVGIGVVPTVALDVVGDVNFAAKFLVGSHYASIAGGFSDDEVGLMNENDHSIASYFTTSNYFEFGHGSMFMSGATGAITIVNLAGTGTGNVTVTSAGLLGRTSLVTQLQGADVASTAGAMTLGNDGNVFEITGTNTITLLSNVGFVNGNEVTLIFTSTATLTNGTATSGTNIKMMLAGAADFVATANDQITLTLGEVGGVQVWREKCRSVN